MGRNNLVGAWGESLAAKHLLQKKYVLDAANYKSRYGEIDLIVHNKKFLVFVEVKLRKSDSFAHAYEFVDVNKQKRLMLTAQLYLSKYPTSLQPRFDVVEVYAPDGISTIKPVIHHIEGAF